MDITPIGQRAPQDVSEAQFLQAQLSEEQVATGKAVKLRRLQRWFFYGVLTVVFLGALLLIVKVYSDNAKLLANLQTASVEITKRDEDLSKTQVSLTEQQQTLQSANASLTEAQTQLQAQTETLEKATARLQELEAKVSELQAGQKVAVNLVLELSVKLTAAQVNKIPLADAPPDTEDSDADGLADEVEAALGTDPQKADSDSDGYSDKQEIVGGFNPLGKGNPPAGEAGWSTDLKLAGQYKSKVILQDATYAWYVAQNSKRYYLGRVDNNFSSMQKNSFWSK